MVRVRTFKAAEPVIPRTCDRAREPWPLALVARRLRRGTLVALLPGLFAGSITACQPRPPRDGVVPQSSDGPGLGCEGDAAACAEGGSGAAPDSPVAKADAATGLPLPVEGALPVLEGVPTPPPGEDDSEDAAPGTESPDRLAARLALFAATKEDKGAEELGGVEASLKGKHYVAGNERDIHVYYQHIRKLGGGYIGVGTDQAYVFVGWQRPEFAWLIDYDPYVMSVHDVYFAFFAAAQTPQEFLHLWSPDAKKEALELIRTRYEGSRASRATAVYGKYRGWIQRRLLLLNSLHREAKVPSFVWHDKTYTYVRELVASGRVRPMVANLLERGAIEAIGATAKELNVPIRVLYLSNAEEYWRAYSRRFRENVMALPFDERSVVLRTLLTWAENMDYRYNLQPVANFRRWLEQDWVRNVYDIARRRKRPEGEERPVLEFSKTMAEPQDVPWNPTNRANKGKAAPVVNEPS